MPRDVTVTFTDGSTHVYQNTPDAVTPEQVTARATQEFGKGVMALDGGRKAPGIGADIPKEPEERRAEMGRVLDKSLRKGAASMPGLIGDVVLSAIRNVNSKASQFAGGGSAPALALQALTRLFGNPAEGTKFGDVTQTLETAGGFAPPVSQPKTKTGKTVANVLEPAVSTALSGGTGSLGSRFVMGAMGGLGGEGAALAFGDTAPVRFLGSLLGSGGAAVAQARSNTPNATSQIRTATQGVTPQDWANAAKFEEVLNATGVPHTKSQLLGPRSTLADVVETASTNPSVRPRLVTATQGASAKAEEALNVWTNQNLPPPGPASRSEVLTDVQKAADFALQQIKDKSNQAFGKAMPPKYIEYDQGRVRTLYNTLHQLADDPRFGKTSDEGKAILRLAEDLVDKRTIDTSRVNPVLMLRARQAAKEKGIPLDPSTIPGAREVTTFVTNAHKINNLNKNLKLKAATDDYKGLPIKDLRRILNEATPEFNRARLAKQAVIENEYNPASQGLTGQLAQMGGGVKPDKQTAKDMALNLVFKDDQPQPEAIRELGRTMGGDQVGELLREHISRTMQRVLKNPNETPDSFVHALYQSPAQKANIDAALEVTARHYKMNPDAVKVGFQRLMETLDTFKDLKVAKKISANATTNEAGKNLLQLSTPATTVRRKSEARVSTETYDKIAELVTSRDGLAKLREIASTPSRTTILHLVSSIYTASKESDVPPENR